VGTPDMAVDNGKGLVQSTRVPPDEVIENALAAEETGGVYFVSSQAMYRYDADQDGVPTITWREPYDGAPM
jgi:hypothetical protein